MQTVPAERANELNSFTVVSMPPMIVTAGVNKLQFFEYVFLLLLHAPLTVGCIQRWCGVVSSTELLADPTMTDEHPIVGALYNPIHRTFITAAGRGVKIWDAQTGELSKRFSTLMNSEITSCALDGTGRRLALGGHDGDIKVRPLC